MGSAKLEVVVRSSRKDFPREKAEAKQEDYCFVIIIVFIIDHFVITITNYFVIMVFITNH